MEKRMTVLFGTEPTIWENPYNSETIKVRDKLTKIKASIRSCGIRSFRSVAISFQVDKTIFYSEPELVLLSN